jgi:hypothetical protein
MDVGSSSDGLQPLNKVITMPSFHSHTVPKLPKSGPTLPVYQCKGAPISLSTAYEGAQILSMYPIWMWEAVSGGIQP